VTIDTLPDDVLLEIFAHYVLEDPEACIQVDDTELWITLTHVCRKWRNIVFEAPCHLNLRIPCTARTRVTAMSNVWPALPIVIRDNYSNVYSGSPLMGGAGNIVAALRLRDRVHQISFLDYPSPLLERIAASMLGSFPALTSLTITSRDHMIPVAVFPEAFLGGSAPRLRSCFLMGIPLFPGIQKLFLSTNQLVELTLRDIPHSGYISPEDVVTCMSAMPNLKQFCLGFRSRESIPSQPNYWRLPPPPTPAVLPSLTEFGFKGASEYMEDLLPRINAPLIYNVSIWLFYLLIFDTPQLYNFLSRTQIFEPSSGAAVSFYDDEVYFRHGHQFSLSITGVTLSRELSSLVQICSLSFPPICSLKRLDIRLNRWSAPHYPGDTDMEYVRWLDFFHPFTALEYLCLDKNAARRIVPALRHSHLAPEGATQMLPALQSLFINELSYPLQEGIVEFVTARQLSGLPVAVYSWDGNSNGSRGTHPSQLDVPVRDI